MRVLVTGAAGFIGSTLVDRLLADGREVVGIDNFDPFYGRERKRENLTRALEQPGFRLVEADIRDRAAMKRIVAESCPEAIVHLAAKAGVRPSIADPAGYADTNILGTIHMLDAAIALERRPRFVFASSSSVYGDRPTVPFRESDSVDHPVSPYAATKKACELIAHTYHHLYQLPVTGLRFFTAFGPRNRPDLAIAKFAALIREGKPIPMFGDGTTRRDYTYIDDIVDGVVRAVDRCVGHHLYNLGHHHPIALREMIETIAAALGREARIETLPEQPGDVRQTFADIDRARAELGYEPRTSFSEGIGRYIEWLSNRPDP
jgi:UDP-glucuronate 4-epimerase